MKREIPQWVSEVASVSTKLAVTVDQRKALQTDCAEMPTNAAFTPTSVSAICDQMWLAVGFIFVLGVLNFALHRAVMESGHELIGQMPGLASPLGKRLMMVVEFLVLLAALALVSNGWLSVALAYLAYSALNGAAAWLVLSGRI